MAEAGEGSKSYVEQVKAEMDNLDPSVFVLATKLLTAEVERVEQATDCIDLSENAKPKVGVKVKLPVETQPKIVGKLLGPRGSTMKAMTEVSGCRIKILGRGSQRDKAKEEEQRASGEPQYAHLNEDLHLSIDSMMSAPKAYTNVGIALGLVQKCFDPEYNPEEDPDFGSSVDGAAAAPMAPGHNDYGHGPPQPVYSAPQPAYGAPQPAYGAPQPAYGAPQPAYGAPQPAHHAPPPQPAHHAPPPPARHDPYATFDPYGTRPDPGYDSGYGGAPPPAPARDYNNGYDSGFGKAPMRGRGVAGDRGRPYPSRGGAERGRGAPRGGFGGAPRGSDRGRGRGGDRGGRGGDRGRGRGRGY